MKLLEAPQRSVRMKILSGFTLFVRDRDRRARFTLISFTKAQGDILGSSSEHYH